MEDVSLSLTRLDETLPGAAAAAATSPVSVPLVVAPVKSLQDLCLDHVMAGRNLDQVLFQSSTAVPLTDWPETLVLKLAGLILLQQRLTPGIARVLLQSDHDAIDALFAHFNINVMATSSVSTPRTCINRVCNGRVVHLVDDCVSNPWSHLSCTDCRP